MIAYLSGIVLERAGAELVVIPRSGEGVGYRVATAGVDVEETDHVALWIHSVTGESGTKLFGFAVSAERDLFVRLLGVEGVGPKTALAVVAAKADPKARRELRMVKGVGDRTAARIAEAFGGEG